jgi:hypothetical protein
MALTIKAGRYRTRDGDIVQIEKRRAQDDNGCDRKVYCWACYKWGNFPMTWTKDGKWREGATDADDLIKRLPLRPKPKRKAGRALKPVTPKKFRVRFAYRLTMRISSSHAIKPGNVMLCIGRAVNAKPLDTHHKTTLEALCRLPHHCTTRGKAKVSP